MGQQAMENAGGEKRVAAYFDLDGTLLGVNSARLWLLREWREGRVTAWQAARGVAFLFAYRAGLADIENATREALSTVRGLEEGVVRARTEQWFRQDVTKYAAPGSWPTIAAHRQRGHALVLLTSSSPYEAGAAAVMFHLDAWISSRYELVEGRFTGEPLLPLCYGAGKIHHAEQHAASANIDVGASYFYTDSYTDLAMLKRVANPRVVAPDTRLKLEARRRGWPVIDWSTSNPTILAGGNVRQHPGSEA